MANFVSARRSEGLDVTDDEVSYERMKEFFDRDAYTIEFEGSTYQVEMISAERPRYRGSILPTGSHPLSAVYSGDTTYASNISDARRVGLAEDGGNGEGRLPGQRLRGNPLKAAPSVQGFMRLQNIRGADDVVAAESGGFQWGSGNYFVAVYGTPSMTSPWMLQVNGHHFALNHTFNGVDASGTPYIIGVEPEVYQAGKKITLAMDGPRTAVG